MSELEPRKHSKGVAVPRHIPQVVVPVPPDQVREFVRKALKGTSIGDPVVSTISGWGFFKPLIRFTPVDGMHTLIELDVVGQVRGAETFLFQQRRAEIDRFFVAIQDQLDREERWTRPRPDDPTAIESLNAAIVPVDPGTQ